MHGKKLEVSRVVVTPEGGAPISATYAQVTEDGVARVTLPHTVGPGRLTLSLTYEAPFGKRLRGLYHVQEGEAHYAFTYFEPLGARRCFPGFDEPAFKTPFDLTVTVPAAEAAVANSSTLGEEPAGPGLKRVRFARTEKLPTYLVALAVGPLDVVAVPPIQPNEVRKHPLPLRGLAARGKGGRLRHVLSEVPAILGTLERYLGIPYPYDKLDLIAVPDFAPGAMENAGAITYRETALLLDERTAPIHQKRRIASTTAHELAHQWFGNLVTMAWWDDLWLNEAFATWMTSRILQMWKPSYRAEVARARRMLSAMRSDGLVAARQIRQPIESGHDIRNAFDEITYSKGGAVLGMFERHLGMEAFRRGVRRHLEKFRFGAATSDDFLASLSEGAGRDISVAFRTFLFQPGVPFVEVRTSCTTSRAEVTLRQSRFLALGSRGDRARSWHVPVCLRYEAGGALREHCRLLTRPEERWSLPEKGCPAWLHPNADGAGYYRFGLPGDGYARLQERASGKLTIPEQLVLADSVDAAFSMARLSASETLSQLAPLADSPERSVAGVPMQLLKFFRDHGVPGPLVPRVEAYARRLYRGALGRVGLLRCKPAVSARESEERRLARRDVVGFLAETARDPEVRRVTGAWGLAYLGRGEKPNPEAVDPDLADVALRVAAQEGGRPVFDRLVAFLRTSRDAQVRGRVLRALGGITDPVLAARARDLLLDPLLRASELVGLVFAHLGRTENREGFWRWLQANFGALLARLPATARGRLPIWGAFFCSEDRAQEAKRFFAPRMDRLPGGPRNLERALEINLLCAARVRAHGESARAFFARIDPRTGRPREGLP
jgi:alanyl aminopeptidase